MITVISTLVTGYISATSHYNTFQKPFCFKRPIYLDKGEKKLIGR